MVINTGQSELELQFSKHGLFWALGSEALLGTLQGKN